MSHWRRNSGPQKRKYARVSVCGGGGGVYMCVRVRVRINLRVKAINSTRTTECLTVGLGLVSAIVRAAGGQRIKSDAEKQKPKKED